LPLKVQLVTVGLLYTFTIPPPPLLAELPLNMQLVTVLFEKLAIPPPSMVAVLPLKIHLVTVGLLLLELYIPPPLMVAVLPLKLQ
jgi:hypothetical protein